MFWRRNSPSSDDLRLLAEAVQVASGLDPATCAAADRTVLGTFFFGMATAHAAHKRWKPQQVHPLVRQVLEERLGFAPEAAGQLVQDCIVATEPDRMGGITLVVNRGMDGHAEHQAGDAKALRLNVQSMVELSRQSAR